MASSARLYRDMEMLNVYFMSLPSLSPQTDRMIQSISVLLFEEHNGESLRHAIIELIPPDALVAKDVIRRKQFYSKFLHFLNLRGIKAASDTDNDNSHVSSILTAVYGTEISIDVLHMYEENKRILRLEAGDVSDDEGDASAFSAAQSSFHDLERHVQSMPSIDLSKPIHQTNRDTRFDRDVTRQEEYFSQSDTARENEIKKMGKSFSKWLKGFSR